MNQGVAAGLPEQSGATEDPLVCELRTGNASRNLGNGKEAG